MLYSRCATFKAQWDCVMKLREFDQETRQTKKISVNYLTVLSFLQVMQNSCPPAPTLSFKGAR